MLEYFYFFPAIFPVTKQTNHRCESENESNLAEIVSEAIVIVDDHNRIRRGLLRYDWRRQRGLVGDGQGHFRHNLTFHSERRQAMAAKGIMRMKRDSGGERTNRRA